VSPFPVRRSLCIGLTALGSTLLLGELVARYSLGLGTPPLYQADPFTEYRLQPNQHLRRFGHRIEVNANSMRSSPLAASPPPAGRRLLVFGDSVVWGGAVLDQRQIATELLKQSGIAEVGNVAAPSWGPGNWLGWARRFGFFQATDVVLVISSHDSYDNPRPEPFRGDANHPLNAPRFALVEGVERYLLPRLGVASPGASASEALAIPLAEPQTPADGRVKRGLHDLRTFLQLARATGARVVVLQFADRHEAATGWLSPANGWIAEAVRQEGVPSVQAGPIFRSCGPVASLYSDGIHPYTAAGQACLARAILLALSQPTS